MRLPRAGWVPRKTGEYHWRYTLYVYLPQYQLDDGSIVGGRVLFRVINGKRRDVFEFPPVRKKARW